MSLDVVAVRTTLEDRLSWLEDEAARVFSTLVVPGWDTNDRFPRTLWSYVGTCFMYVDLYSAYWQGVVSAPNGGGRENLTTGQRDRQPARMLEFMRAYMWNDAEVCAVALQLWRHTLLHTAEPRDIVDVPTGRMYRYLLHWGPPHLPADQHATFQSLVPPRVLNIGLTYLIADVRRALGLYLTDLEKDPALQAKYLHADKDIQLQKCRF